MITDIFFSLPLPAVLQRRIDATLQAEDRILGPQLHATLVDELYRQSLISLVALPLPLVFIRMTVDAATRSSALANGTFVAMLAIITLRLAWLAYLSRHPGLSVQLRHLVFILGTFITGLAFMALNIAVFPLLGAFPLALLCICEAGISATAMVTMASSPVAALAYMFPMVGSLAVLGTLHPMPDLAMVFVLVVLVFMSSQVSVSLSAHRSLRKSLLLSLKLGDLALRDTLTGLRNRRYLEEFREDETNRILRSWHPDSIASGKPSRTIALLMVDLDHFKTVNDTHGHAAGDEVLKQAADLLRQNIRKPDLAMRWGGEEFLILVRETCREMPLVAVERIRSAIEDHVFHLSSGKTLKLTCSLGYAHFPFHPHHVEALDWSQVLHLADEALYQAKHAGRNRAYGIVTTEIVSPEKAQEMTLDFASLKDDKGIQKALDAGLLRLLA